MMSAISDASTWGEAWEFFPKTSPNTLKSKANVWWSQHKKISTTKKSASIQQCAGPLVMPVVEQAEIVKNREYQREGMLCRIALRGWAPRLHVPSLTYPLLSSSSSNHKSMWERRGDRAGAGDAAAEASPKLMVAGVAVRSSDWEGDVREGAGGA